MNLYAGCSGFSYKEWKGPFYPEKLSANRMLDYYSRAMNTVEINSTFYRMPKPETLATWAQSTPESFRFVLKTPRRITHNARLVDVGEPFAYFCATAAHLGPRLGPFLVQTPPSLSMEISRLELFLQLLPKFCRAAFEFRHPSWKDERVLDLMSRHNCAWCVADTDGSDLPVLPRTADWGYLRLRASDYSGEEMDKWVARIRDQSWGEAFVFFKHEDDGAAPRLAKALQRTWAMD